MSSRWAGEKNGAELIQDDPKAGSHRNQARRGSSRYFILRDTFENDLIPRRRDAGAFCSGAISSRDYTCTRRGKDSVKIREVQAVHHTNIYTACTRAIEGPARLRSRALVARVIHGSGPKLAPAFRPLLPRRSIFRASSLVALHLLSTLCTTTHRQPLREAASFPPWLALFICPIFHPFRQRDARAEPQFGITVA